jgi:hypothetical protein
MTRRTFSISNTHKALFSLLMVFALLLSAFTPSYSLAQDKTKSDKAERKVTKKVKLKPTKDAEVIIPDFTATFYDDGTRSVGGTDSGGPNMPVQAFDFEVDLKNGPYKTTRVDPDIANREEQAVQAEASTTNPVVPTGSMGTLAVPGIEVYKVRVVGKDLASIVLNQTTNRLEWRVNSNGTVTWLSYLSLE